jgi:chromosomal replication initiator protein
MDINNEYTEPGSGGDNGTRQGIQNPAEGIWREALENLRGRISSQSFKTWIEPIVPLKLDRNVFFVQVPSQFFSEWLDEHYYSLLSEVLTKATGLEVQIEYAISKDDPDISWTNELHGRELPPIPEGKSADTSTAWSPANQFRVVMKPQPLPPLPQTLNKRYTFDNYIKGESNQFARAAATAVANNPGGTSFNPLVIYGGVGLGKTHLVQAIGNHLITTGKSQRVLYISSEKFTVDFVDAIQKDSVSGFSNFYRSVDLLIVDDIQFFAGKEKTQDYFFHTFNALHQQGKQIVLSCDKPPKDLKGLNERLISRFQWGLTADIQPPDLETRIAILRKKSADDNIDLPGDVIDFIAANVTTNIRELEGCLISLLARASLNMGNITVDLARDVVRSIVGEVREHITIEEIQKAVCSYFNIPEDLIRAKTRKQEIVNARQVAMYLAKELTSSSLKTIGLHFGGRDHSTVIHAYQTVEDGMKTDPKQKHNVDQLLGKLNGRSRS